MYFFYLYCCGRLALNLHLTFVNVFGARMEKLITSHEQKVAMLTEKLKNSQTTTDGLQHQLDILQ